MICHAGTRVAHLVDLSAARQALTSEPLAPPTEATLQQLTDPSRRPGEPCCPLPPDILDAAPAAPLALDLLGRSLRACCDERRGAAPGPSGYTAEIPPLVLDEDDASQFLFEVACLLAPAHVPESAVVDLALGRVVALSNPDHPILKNINRYWIFQALLNFTSESLELEFFQSFHRCIKSIEIDDRFQ